MPIIDALIEFLSTNSLLLLFVITGIGHLLGRIRIGSFSLGVAAILFTGLGVGALHPSLRLPPVINQFGLVLFVYTLGLSAGPAFFTSLRRRGLGTTAIATCSILAAALVTVLMSRLLELPGPLAGGVFVGSLTSTPALAAALEFVSSKVSDANLVAATRALPIVGYSLGYPISVISIMLVMHLAARLFKVDFAEEANQLGGVQAIVDADVEVTQPEVFGKPIREILPRRLHNVVISRLLRGDRQMTVGGDVRLEPGDVVTLVGPEREVQTVTAKIGRPSGVHPHLDRSQIDVRRMVVSNREIAGRRLDELNIRQRFGGTISRIRRGDVDVVPTADFVLELGDQVRVVAPRDQLPAIARFLGDSYKTLGEIDIISISLGMALGLIVGALPIPLPGGLVFQLGFAGGPLLVALVLGYLGRTGSVIWIMPYNVNLTLRELGLILFLAGIGTQAADGFAASLGDLGWRVLLASAVVSVLFSFSTLLIGYKLLKIPMTVMYGLLAGIQTQSASLAFANDRTGNDHPNLPYAMVYPTAVVLKILLVQVLISLLGPSLH